MNPSPHQFREDFGFSLIPTSRNKRPPISWEQYQGVQCSEQELRLWLQKYHGLGIVTGALSGVVVVDLDTSEAVTWAINNLPATPWKTLTGRKNQNRGQHWFYLNPDFELRNDANLSRKFPALPAGIDIRGEGGYVVAPGTKHESGVTYEAMGDWDPNNKPPVFSWDWFGERKKPEPPPQQSYTPPRETDPYRNAKVFLSRTPVPNEGTRNPDTYSAACGCFNLGCSLSEVEQLINEWIAPAIAYNFDWNEVQQCITSAHGTHKPPISRYVPPVSTSPQPQPTRQKPEPLPEAAPEPTDAATYTERLYLCAAWDDQTASATLANYGPDRWKDPACKAAHAAIRSLHDQDKTVDPTTVGFEMKRQGNFPHFITLEAWAHQRLTQLGGALQTARTAFADQCHRDDLAELLEDCQAQLQADDPKTVLASLYQELGTMLASMGDDAKTETVKSIVEDILNDAAEGKPPAETHHIPFFSEVIGRASGGDVIPYCGPPKTGKSFLLRTLRDELARAGVSTVTSQLELHKAQIAARELQAHYYKPELDQLTARRILKEQKFDHHAQSYVIRKGHDIASHRAELWEFLAKHPEVKVWLLDYNERLYTYGGKNSDVNYMAASVAKFVKDTALRFGVVAIPLLQPNGSYAKTGAYGPIPDHVDYGKQWVKDCTALGFLHKPHKFDTTQPEDLTQLVWMNARNAAPTTQNLTFVPQESRFIKRPDQPPALPLDKAVNDFRARQAKDYETLSEIDFP